MRELFELHTARWREAGEAGSFADERRCRFYSTLARGWADAGELRLVRLLLEGKTIAVQFGALVDATYYQIQEGYDPAHAEWRCGTALRALAIGDLIDEGVGSYDFLAGDSRHKRDWGGAPRPCKTIALPVGGLRARGAYRLRALLDARAAAD